MVEHICSKEKVIETIAKAQIESDKKDVLQAEKMLRMQEDIGEVKVDIKTILTKIELLENKFASKRVERIVKGMIGLILVAVFTAMLAKVIVK